MSQIRLYIDEDAMDRVFTRALRAREIDVLTAAEAGMVNCSDREQFEYAARCGRALYTCNASDFYRLHSEYLDNGRTHSGLILLAQQRYSIGEQLRKILRLLTGVSAEQMCNRVEFLSNWD